MHALFFYIRTYLFDQPACFLNIESFLVIKVFLIFLNFLKVILHVTKKQKINMVVLSCY